MWREGLVEATFFRVLHRAKFFNWNHVISGQHSTGMELSKVKHLC